MARATYRSYPRLALAKALAWIDFEVEGSGRSENGTAPLLSGRFELLLMCLNITTFYIGVRIDERSPSSRSGWPIRQVSFRLHLSAPLRHAAVDLHRRQMRSPAHALGNGDRQMRHFLILYSKLHSKSELGSVSSALLGASQAFSRSRRDGVSTSSACLRRLSLSIEIFSSSMIANRPSSVGHRRRPCLALAAYCEIARG